MRSTAARIASASLCVLFMGATLPTPIYPLYERAFGFSRLTLTLIYAAYVLGNLVALMALGRLADQIGRRTTVLLAVGVALLGVATFLAADNAGWLALARAISGLATSLGAGATAAWLADLQTGPDRDAAARRATIANFLGIASGPLISAIVAVAAPAPLTTSWLVYGAVLLGLAAAVSAAEDAPRPSGGQPLSLWPRLGVPRKILAPFLANSAAAFAVFALIGFYGALIPSVLAERLAIHSPLAAGAVLAEMFVIAAVSVAATAALGAERAVRLSLGLLAPCLALLVAAELLRSTATLVAATAFGGVAAALGYRGTLAGINAIAPAERRSEVVSLYLIAVYCGNALPVIGVGVVSRAVPAPIAHALFAVFIAIVAAAAFVGLRRGEAAAT